MKGLLSHLGVINCIGTDSQTFLQGQLTCDLKALTPGTSTLAAHCNLQGRIVSLSRLLHIAEGDYRLILPKNMVRIALDALKKYAVFSKVTLTEGAPYLVGHDDGTISFSTEKPAETDISHQWHQQDILAGIPAIYPETSGLFIPQRLNLVELGAISFKKGCYLGQEILSRLYFKSTVKYHMVTAKLDRDVVLLKGEPVLDNTEKTCGHLVDQNDRYLLIEKLIESPLPLLIQGIRCNLLNET